MNQRPVPSPPITPDSGTADLVNVLGTVAQVSAGMLSMAVAVLALTPILLDFVASDNNKFRSRATMMRIQRGLALLRWAIWLFGIETAVALAGLLIRSQWLMVLAVIGLVASVCVLVWVGHLIAQVLIGGVDREQRE